MDVTQFWAILGLLITILLANLAGFGWLLHRIDGVDKRLASLEIRVSVIETKLTEVDRRLSIIENTLQMIGYRTYEPPVKNIPKIKEVTGE